MLNRPQHPQKIKLSSTNEQIKDTIIRCLARELTTVEERKDAIEFRQRRPKSFDIFDEINADMSAVKSVSYG